MSYAIPRNVKSIAENLITIDYFGEERKARNDFYKLQVGDYVYAQDGFVVQEIDEKDAEEIPDTKVRQKTMENMKSLIYGERDLYF